MKLKEGIYYNAKFDSIVEITAVLKISKGGYYVLFDMGQGKYLLPFKSVEVIESELIIYLGKL